MSEERKMRMALSYQSVKENAREIIAELKNLKKLICSDTFIVGTLEKVYANATIYLESRRKSRNERD